MFPQIARRLFIGALLATALSSSIARWGRLSVSVHMTWAAAGAVLAVSISHLGILDATRHIA